MISRTLRFAFAAILGVFSIHASLITSVPIGGITTTFAGGNSCFNGPTSGTDAGLGISADSGACYNYGLGWGFGYPGDGTLDNPGSTYENYWFGWGLVGDNTNTTTITIDLHGGYAAVGGFLNYFEANDGSPTYGPAAPTISAIGADGMTVLESHNLSADNPFYADPDPTYIEGNQGYFEGIAGTSEPIYYFRISGSDIALHNLTVAAPEPASLGAIGFGGLLLFWRVRRRRA